MTTMSTAMKFVKAIVRNTNHLHLHQPPAPVRQFVREDQDLKEAKEKAVPREAREVMTTMSTAMKYVKEIVRNTNHLHLHQPLAPVRLSVMEDRDPREKADPREAREVMTTTAMKYVKVIAMMMTTISITTPCTTREMTTSVTPRSATPMRKSASATANVAKTK
jgi:hypothetical protein